MTWKDDVQNSSYFILENGVPKRVSWRKAIAWMSLDRDFSKRRVARTTVGKYDISTVFLVFDHSFFGSVPILFETLVWHGDDAIDSTMERYSTLEDAIIGHERMVARVRDGKIDESGE